MADPLAHVTRGYAHPAAERGRREENRGERARCHAEPQYPSKGLSRMGGFGTSTVISAPLDAVAEFLSDLENDPRWRREWVAAEAVTEGRVRVGTTTALFAQLAGRRVKTVYEVSAHEPSRFTEWRTVSGPFPLTFQRAFEAVEGGTKVTFRYDARTPAFLRLVEPLFIRTGRRQLDGDLPALRAILEG